MEGRDVAQDNPARLCVLHTRSVLEGSTQAQRTPCLLQAKVSGEEPHVVGRAQDQRFRSAACVTPGGALPFSGLSVLSRG